MFQKVTCPNCQNGELRSAISLVPAFCFMESNAVFCLERAQFGESVFSILGEAIASVGPSTDGVKLFCEAIDDHLSICDTRIAKGVSLVGMKSHYVSTLTGGAVYVKKAIRFQTSPSPGRFNFFLLLVAPPDMYGDMCRAAMTVSFASNCF